MWSKTNEKTIGFQDIVEFMILPDFNIIKGASCKV